MQIIKYIDLDIYIRAQNQHCFVYKAPLDPAGCLVGQSMALCHAGAPTSRTHT